RPHYTAPSHTGVYTPPLHDALPIYGGHQCWRAAEEIRHLDGFLDLGFRRTGATGAVGNRRHAVRMSLERVHDHGHQMLVLGGNGDRKSTRLNSSHGSISYAVFCLQK